MGEIGCGKRSQIPSVFKAVRIFARLWDLWCYPCSIPDLGITLVSLLCALCPPTAGFDFTFDSQVLTFAAGALEFTADVGINDDSFAEREELFFLDAALTDPSLVGRVAVLPNRTEIRIRDNDGELYIYTSHYLIVMAVYNIVCSCATLAMNIGAKCLMSYSLPYW